MSSNPRLIPRFDVEFGVDDLRRAMQPSPQATSETLKQLSRWWPGRNPVFVDSGRTALYLALRALKLGDEPKIGVPLFTCEAVFAAIVQAGCRPVFLDVDPNTVTLDPASVEQVRNELDAIVVIHTFGYPADLDSIATAATGVPIVEDCAHAVGAMYRGAPVGNTGVFSFFSFRSGKAISAGKLGMLLPEDEAAHAEASAISATLPVIAPSRHLLNSLTEAARSELYHRPWFGAVSLPVGLRFDQRFDLMDKSGFGPRRAAEGSIGVLESRLKVMESRLARRRTIARCLLSALPSGVRAPQEHPEAIPSYFQAILRFPDKDARDIGAEKLASLGVDSVKFYHETPARAQAYGYRGECPITEALCKTVLAVPCYENLSDRDADRIAAALASLGA